jgi:hypothetical protein
MLGGVQMSKFADLLKPEEAEGIQDFDSMAEEAAQPDPGLVAPAGPRFQIPEWLKADTGEGSIESYLDHPMNFNKSRAMARVIRGFTGMFGSLRYAVIDIVLGGMELGRERKAKMLPVEVPTNAPRH